MPHQTPRLFAQPNLVPRTTVDPYLSQVHASCQTNGQFRERTPPYATLCAFPFTHQIMTSLFVPVDSAEVDAAVLHAFAS